MENYSILMSVYQKETPENLRLSMESMLTQTVMADEFVLVCDGPLTEALDAVVLDYQNRYPQVMRIVRLQNNQGLANALNAGLRVCRNSLVARMDSDDFAPPERCQLQVDAFEKDPELVLVGGTVKEFVGEPSHVTGCKQMPLTQQEILRYARKRNPFNHPTVMFRAEAIRDAGGYPDSYRFHEDYALWAKLLLRGAKTRNLPDVLCYMRTDNGLYRRRGGRAYWKAAVKFRWHLYRIGLYSLMDFVYVSTALTLTCLAPASFRKVIYQTFLRKNTEK